MKEYSVTVNMGSNIRPGAKQLSYTMDITLQSLSVAFASERKRALWDSLILAMRYIVNNVYFFL